MTKIRDHKEIWLQVNEDRADDEVTWAENSIYNDDVLYIRFDIVAQLETKLEAMEKVTVAAQLAYEYQGASDYAKGVYMQELWNEVEVLAMYTDEQIDERPTKPSN